MDHIEIIQRLNALKEQLLKSNGGFLNRNIKAIDKAVEAVECYNNLQTVLAGRYLVGIITGVIISSILIAIFG